MALADAFGSRRSSSWTRRSSSSLSCRFIVVAPTVVALSRDSMSRPSTGIRYLPWRDNLPEKSPHRYFEGTMPNSVLRSDAERRPTYLEIIDPRGGY